MSVAAASDRGQKAPVQAAAGCTRVAAGRSERSKLKRHIGIITMCSIIIMNIRTVPALTSGPGSQADGGREPALQNNNDERVAQSGPHAGL